MTKEEIAQTLKDWEAHQARKEEIKKRAKK